MERLRLVSLFALRYEHASNQISELKTILKKQGLKPDMVELIDLLLDYAGKANRSQDLFLNKTIFKST